MNDQDIPIDIHAAKLLDWLISRRHCKNDFQKAILIIRQKINNAIQDMPAVDQITELLVGSYINYFHCEKIVGLLKETEASSKNIFGVYSSQRMKDWQEIIQLYEKDDVFLADAAQILTRNINYEIPSLKKQIIKCTQMQDEYLKKESDYGKSANDMKAKYFSSCEAIGIEGKNVKAELLTLLEQLPEALHMIVNETKGVAFIQEFYESFLFFTLSRSMDDNCCPLLKYMIIKGNTSTFEWRTGEQPDVVEVTKPEFPLDVDNGSTETGDDQIDFGDFCINSESGDDRSSSSPNGDFVHVEKGDCSTEANDQIDFGDNDADINWDITVEKSDIGTMENIREIDGGKVARGNDALSILENSQTRNMFHNELLELEGFLKQRLAEMQSESNILALNQFQSASANVQFQSYDSVSEMFSSIQQLIDLLMSEKLKHLYSIKESSKYVDRLSDLLKTKLDASEKMLQYQKSAHEKYLNVVEEQRRLDPRLKLIISKTVELKNEIEAVISKRYKNRPVNIIGLSNI